MRAVGNPGFFTQVPNPTPLTSTPLAFFGTAGAIQQVISQGNTNGEIGGLTISAVYSQVEVQALRDKCEELADDVRSLRAALLAYGLVV